MGGTVRGSRAGNGLALFENEEVAAVMSSLPTDTISTVTRLGSRNLDPVTGEFTSPDLGPSGPGFAADHTEVLRQVGRRPRRDHRLAVG